MIRTALLLLWVASSVTAGEKSQEASPESCRKLIREVWERMNKGFYDPKMNGVDWPAVRDRYLARANAAMAREDLFTLVDEMVAELHTSHAGFQPYDDPRKRSNEIGMRVIRTANGEFAIRSIHADPQSPARVFRPGMIVTGIDGVPVGEHAAHYRTLIEKRVSHSTDSAVDGVLERVFFNGPIQSRVRVG